MRNALKGWLLGVVVAAAIATILPQLEVEYACVRPISEGCVWGRALITVNRVATFFLIGMPAGGLIVWWRRGR